MLHGHPFDFVILDHMMPDVDGIELARRIRAAPSFAHLRLVLSSSHADATALETVRRHGFETILAKPLQRSRVLEAVCGLLGIERRGKAALVPEPSPSEAPSRRLRLLLAEDNKVNQMVAMTLLVKAGHRVDIAANGFKAVRMHRRFPCDMILMDMQMPEMDGLEATRRLRAIEQAGVRIPIIAMTANAMQCDRERCAETGMDDSVTKPVDVAELHAAIRRWSDQVETMPANEAVEGSVPAAQSAA